MAPVLRPAVAWLLALLMPFQALTAVYLDVRGPAHFHVVQDAAPSDLQGGTAAVPEHEHGRAHEFSHVLEAMGLKARGRDVHSHSYGGHGVERHHHQRGDPSVVTIDGDGLPTDFALKEETTAGWSGAMLATLPSGGPLLQSPAGLDAPAPRPDPLPQNRTLGRLERPPRTLPG